MHDTVALKLLLSRLAPALSGSDEIIVVDAEQSETCADICAYFGARYLSNNASRGSRMNFGAADANNEILWFIHADAEPDLNGADTIRQSIRGGIQAGYFKFRFTGTRPLFKRALEGAINLRAIVGIPYGDQALFMTRSAFKQAGGYADTSLFEEVGLVKALQRAGDFTRMQVTVGVSSRRWERDGWLRRTVQNRLLVLGHWLGVPSNTLARMYRGSTPQSAAPSVADNTRT